MASKKKCRPIYTGCCPTVLMDFILYITVECGTPITSEVGGGGALDAVIWVSPITP